MKFDNINLCLTDVVHENRSSLVACWNLAKQSPETAAERYGISVGYAEKVANLTREDVEKTINVSQALFSLRYKENEIFQVKPESGLPLESPETIEAIEKENRAALIIRWNAARVSLDDCMDRFGITRSFAERLASLPYEFIERAANVKHPLLKMSCPEPVIDLVPRSLNSDEITIFMVLHD